MLSYLDLTDLITNSRNYNELRDAWKGWRDVSGAQMKSLYQEYVELLNKAIKDGGISSISTYYNIIYSIYKMSSSVTVSLIKVN